MKCLTCSSDTFIDLFSAKDYLSKETFYLERCDNCSMIRTRGIESEAQLSKYYSDNYYGDRKSFVDLFVNSIRVFKINNYKKFEGSKKVLDIGCGEGTFLLSMKKNNWEVSGTETSHDHIEALKKKRISVCDEAKGECNFSNKSFDLITLWHVLEHVINPKEVLIKANGLLKDKGRIIIEVPNFGSWQATFAKGSWFHIDVPRHVYHFTQSRLEKLLEETGFVVEKVSFFEPFYDIFGFIQSVLNKVSKEQNLLFSVVGRKKTLNELLTNTKVRDILSIVILIIPLGTLGVIQFFINLLFRKGAIMTVYGKKG